MSTELTERASEIIKKAQMPNRHTFYQLQKFVIGKEPTGQAQLWQIVRELEVRLETVESYRKDLEDAEDNLELFDLKIERLDRDIRMFAEVSKEDNPLVDLDIKEREINIRKLQREKESLVKAAQKVNKKMTASLEEMHFLVQAFDAIVAQIGEMKPLDDEAAQREMWNEKLLEEFNLRILLQRPLDPELVKTIMCLHDEAVVKQHLTRTLEAKQRAMIEQAAEQQKLQRPQVEAKAKVSGNG
jgi:hypothetical protein